MRPVEVQGRSALAWLSAGLLVVAAAQWAVSPWARPGLDVAAVRRAVERSAWREVSRPLADPPADPRAVLAELAIDPQLRASTAAYQAALLRPDAIGSEFSSRLAGTGASQDRVLRAVGLVDRLFASAQGRGLRASSQPLGLQATIGSAAAIAGVDRAYLLRTADIESGFNPYARAGNTTARGLFQFVEQTWLTSVARWGARHGLGQEARLVRFDTRGRAFVADPSAKRAILALRYDPDLAARLAAELAADNASILRESLGRAPSAKELYAAHLLGPAGAARLIHTAYSRPAYPAAWLFPRAAAKNPRLFYRAGDPRSVSELLLGLS